MGTGTLRIRLESGPKHGLAVKLLMQTVHPLTALPGDTITRLPAMCSRCPRVLCAVLLAFSQYFSFFASCRMLAYGVQVRMSSEDGRVAMCVSAVFVQACAWLGMVEMFAPYLAVVWHTDKQDHSDVWTEFA